MRFLLHRKLVTPLLFGAGLLAMIGGDIDGGAWIDAFGIAYWVVAGWVGAFRTRHAPSRPTQQFTAQITARSSRVRRSDGATGAFSRLDPAWRDWLAGEAVDRDGRA